MDPYQLYTKEYKDTLDSISENFTENVTRQFKEHVERRRNSKNPNLLLTCVGFTQDHVSIKFQNLKLMTPILFELLHLNIDLKDMVIDVKFALHDLLIESDYKVVSQIFGIDIVQHGKMRFTLKNVHATGKVGMFIRDDSFMPVNYDIDYTFDEIQTEILEAIPIGQPCQHNNFDVKRFSSSNVETKLDASFVNLFWVELEENLTDTLHRHLGSIIVEYSMSELLLDEPAQVKKYESYRTKVANVYFDEWIKDLKNEYTKHSEFATTPPLSVTIKQASELSKFESSIIRLMDLDTICRITEVNYYANEEGQTYFAYVSINDFHFKFEDCKLNHMKRNLNGNLKAHFESNKLLIRIHIPSNNSRRQIFARFVKIGQITLDQDFTKHDAHALTWIKKKLEPYFIGYIRLCSSNVMKKLEGNYNI